MDVLHPFHARVLVGAEAQCSAQGCDILFTLFKYSARVPWTELHLPKLMRRRDVANALILAGNNSENLLLALRQRGVPFALLGNNVLGAWQGDSYDSVRSDSVQGAYEITRYLVSLGHRHVWYVGNCKLPCFAASNRGYSQAMQDSGLLPQLSDIDSEDDEEIGYLGTRTIFGTREPVTAIFAGTDHAAQGVYKAAFDRGLRIPRDLSVVGCNDTYGRLLHPPLTTIREYPEQFGKRLAQMALERIRNADAPPQQVIIPTAIAKRESCLPCGVPPESIAGRQRPDEAPVVASDAAHQL